MSIQREGIDRVHVFVLPDGIDADGRFAAVSRAALVTWRSSHVGMLYQVYVNGRFAGATLDVEQRQLVVLAPQSFRSALRLEVLGVEPREAHIDFADKLGISVIGSGRVRLTLLRSQTLPPGAALDIYCDHGAGEVDYGKPLNTYPIPVWACWQDKAGFGMARFGTSDFGFDSAASVGTGMGSFGYGQFGLDADVIEWISPALPLGSYRFSVVVTDADGNKGAANETEAIAVIPPARPAARLNVASFDASGNLVVLAISA